MKTNDRIHIYFTFSACGSVNVNMLSW